MEMKGRYFETRGTTADSRRIIFVEAQKLPIDEMNFSSWIRRIDFVPSKDTIWLYRTESFEVKLNDVKHNYEWNVADWAFNYEEFFFDSFESLSNFVLERWKVDIFNFVKAEDISIPLG
jgi:hypothetical protein